MRAKLVTLIETSDSRGQGTEESPCRTVPQWWTIEGELVVERDPWLPEAVRTLAIECVERAAEYGDPKLKALCKLAMQL